MNYDLTKFKEYIDALGISLNDEQYSQFIMYYEMLVEKNKVMNLTAITEFDDVIVKHFVDSLSLAKYMDLTKPVKILDMGTGAGFPGIPLKIAFPQIEVTLADSLNKRIKFLQEVIDGLKLEKITAVHARAEEMAMNKEYRESFDLCVSRAVANLSTLAEYCVPFVHVGGTFISYKSGDCDEEIQNAKNAVKLLGGEIEKIEKFQLEDAGRSFVFINKINPTKKKYPRKAGTPSKDPL